MKDLRMVWGAGAGGFNVHSVYGMQDRFGDVWRWISEGATMCETSCAALNSQLKDGTGPEMYGRGNGYVLAGTRYYPPALPPSGANTFTNTARLCPVYQRGFQEEGVVQYWATV